MERDFNDRAQPSDVSVDISDEVAAVLGVELTQRCRTDARFLKGWCYVCFEPFDAHMSPIAILVERHHEYILVNGSHSHCATSRIFELAEVDALERTARIQTSLGLWRMPYGELGIKTVLILSIPYVLAKITERGELSDAHTTDLLRRGWGLASGTDADPPSITEGQFIGWQSEQTGEDSRGPTRIQMLQDSDDGLDRHVFNIASIIPESEYDCARTGTKNGWIDVYIGPFGIHAWDDTDTKNSMIEAAFRSGRTVGARLAFREIHDLARRFPFATIE